MVLIMAKNPVTKPLSCRTRLRPKSRGIVDQVMVTMEKDILMVAKIIKVLGILNRINLEWQTLPALLMVDFIVLMEFG